MDMERLQTFLVSVVLNSVGIWLAFSLLSNTDEVGYTTFLLAGVIFGVVNATIKPVLSFLSLPLVFLTLGLFTLIINGLMFYLTVSLTPGLEMGFWYSVVAGMIVGLLNAVVNNFTGE